MHCLSWVCRGRWTKDNVHGGSLHPNKAPQIYIPPGAVPPSRPHGPPGAVVRWMSSQDSSRLCPGAAYALLGQLNMLMHGVCKSACAYVYSCSSLEICCIDTCAQAAHQRKILSNRAKISTLNKLDLHLSLTLPAMSLSPFLLHYYIKTMFFPSSRPRIQELTLRLICICSGGLTSFFGVSFPYLG